jgi:glycosyltransferase involved in cell wall biosynthesis
VARRIKKYYRRESEVIHPPVEIEKFSLGEPKNYFLAGGRLVPYKRFDLVVQAFNKLGIPLKIFGEGPAEEYLFELAKDNIEFLGKVSDEERAALYRQAIAFIHPQIEDFGITAVESMASGRPVIAYGEGGALETILPNQTGVFFEEQTWESLADAVLHFFPERFDPKSVRGHALQFSKEVFQDKMRQYVGKTRQQFS